MTDASKPHDARQETRAEMQKIDVKTEVLLGTPKPGDEVLRIEDFGHGRVMSTVRRRKRSEAKMPSQPLTVIEVTLAARGRIWTDQAVLTLTGHWLLLSDGSPMSPADVSAFTLLSEPVDEYAGQLIESAGWTFNDRTSRWILRR